VGEIFCHSCMLRAVGFLIVPGRCDRLTLGSFALPEERVVGLRACPFLMT